MKVKRKMWKRAISFMLVIFLLAGNVTSSFAAVSGVGTVHSEDTYTQEEGTAEKGDNTEGQQEETGNTHSDSSDNERGEQNSGDGTSETEGERAGETGSESKGENTGETEGETEGGSSGGTEGEAEGETTGETEGETEGETTGETEEESEGGTAGETEGGSKGNQSGKQDDKKKPDDGKKNQGVVVTELDIDNAIEFTLRGVRDDDASFQRTRDVLLDIQVNLSDLPIDEIRKAELTLNLPYFEPDGDEFVVSEEETEFGFGARVVSAEGWKVEEVPYSHKGKVVFKKADVHELSNGIVTVRLSPFGYFDLEMVGELSATLQITSGVQAYEVALTDGIRLHEPDEEDASSEIEIVDDREQKPEESTEATKEAETEKETPAEETQASETSAEETREAETSAAETKESETSAAETKESVKPTEETKETEKPKEETSATKETEKTKEETGATKETEKPKQETAASEKLKAGTEAESKAAEKPKAETTAEPESTVSGSPKISDGGVKLSKLDIPQSRLSLSMASQSAILGDLPLKHEDSAQSEDSTNHSQENNTAKDNSKDETEEAGEFDDDDVDEDEHGYKYEIYCSVKQELKYQPEERTQTVRARSFARAAVDENSLEAHITFNGPETSADRKSQVVSTDQEAEILVQLKPNWSEGTADKVRVHVRIPFLKNNGDGRIVTGGPEDSDMKVVLTSVNADDTWHYNSLPESGFTGEFVIFTDAINGGGSRSFKMKLRFSGELPENATAQINAYVEYDSFDEDGPGWSTPDVLDPNSIVTMVASNLIWGTELVCKQDKDGTVIWDRFNYIPFEYSIFNESEKPEAIINSFTFNLNLPLSTVAPARGVFEKDLRMWLYKGEGQEPEYNENSVSALYVGNPGKGGIVIYDITDEDNPVGPLPYIYSGSGGVTINIDKGLYAPSALTSDLVQKAVFRIEIPFPTYFERLPDKDRKLTTQPSVAIGDPGSALSWSKYNEVKYSLDEPVDSMVVTKTGPGGKSFFGTLSDFTIGNIKNTGNFPLFDSYLEDTMFDEPKEGEYKGRSLTWSVTARSGEPEPDPRDFFITNDAPKVDKVATVVLQGRQSGQRDLTLSDFVKQETVNSDGSRTFTYTYDTDTAFKARGTYIKKFTIYLKERIEPEEELPGHIILGGYPRTRTRVDNTVQLRYNIKIDQSDTVNAGRDPIYPKVFPTGTAKGDATMLVQEPSLKVDATGENLQIPNGEGAPKGKVEVDYQKRNAYNFYPQTHNPAIISPGIVKIDLRSITKDKTGFIADRVYFGKYLVYDETERNINSITITDFNSTDKEPIVRTFSSEELYNGWLEQDGDGYALDLTKIEGIVELPRYITIELETFPGSIENMNKDYSIRVEGLANLYGDMRADVYWTTSFKDETKRQADSYAIISGVQPMPLLEGAGMKNRAAKIENGIYVDYKDKNGFRFYPQNRSSSVAVGPMRPAIFEATLPVDYDAGADEPYRGILLEELVISKELLALAPEGIDLLVLQDKRGSNITISFKKEDLAAFMQDGAIVIPQSAWSDTIEMVEKVLISFPAFNKSVQEDLKSNEHYIQFYGETNKFGTLTAAGKWTCPVAKNPTSIANPVINVAPPLPILNGSGVKDKGSKVENGVKVAIDEINGFRFYPENYDSVNSRPNPAGAFKPGILEIVMPVSVPNENNPEYCGVLLKEIHITAQLLEQAPKGISSLVLQDKAGNSRTVEFTNAELEALKDGDGSIIITEDMWQDKAGDFEMTDKIIITFPEFIETEKNDPLRNERYVALYGLTNKYGLLAANGTWSCPIAEGDLAKGKATATATASIETIAPNPLNRVTANYEELSASRVDIPYGRGGFYQYDFANESAAQIKKATAALTLQVDAQSVNKRGIDGRGFFTQQTIVSEKLLPFVDEITFYNAVSDGSNPTKAEYVITLVGDELKDSAGKVWWTKGTGGDLVIDIDDPGIPDSLTRIKQIDVSMTAFGENIVLAPTAPKHEYYVRTTGWFNGLPELQPQVQNWNNRANNVATCEWTYQKEAGAYDRVRGTAQVRITPANIDMAMHARFADKFLGDFVAKNSQYRENHDSDNQVLDIGYKALGSFTVDIEQLKLKSDSSNGNTYYMYNTPLGITMDVNLPYKDFETYYLRIKQAFLPHIEEINVYRQDGLGEEDANPWVTISGAELEANAPISGDYRRINLLREDNASNGELYATRDVARDKTQDADHPYYRSVEEEMWEPNGRVTRVSIRFKLNQNVKDGSGNLMAPDFSAEGAGEMLLDFAGRVTSAETTGVAGQRKLVPFYAENSMVYDFGLDSTTGGKYPGSKMADEVPESELFSGSDDVKTVSDMLDRYIYQSRPPYNRAPHNYKGTSTTKTFMVTVQSRVEVRKDIQDPVRISGTKQKDDHIFGMEGSYYIAFYRDSGSGYHANGNLSLPTKVSNTANDWSKWNSTVDEFKIVDTLPPVFERTNISPGDINLYEGILTTGITLEQALLDLKPKKLIVTIKDEQQVLHPKEFEASAIPETLKFVYWDGSGTEAAATTYDAATNTFTMKRKEFPVSFELYFDGFLGDGDVSHDIEGYSRDELLIRDEANKELPPMIKVTGKVLFNDYNKKPEIGEASESGFNRVTSIPQFKSGEEACYPVTDSARMKAEISPLSASLDIRWRHSMSDELDTEGKGVGFDYDPTKQSNIHDNYDDPTEFTFEYNLSNPAASGGKTKSPIARFDISLLGDAGFRARNMTIPKEIFDGDYWELDSLKIAGRDSAGKDKEAVLIDKSRFSYSDVTGNYVLNLRSLFGDGNSDGDLGGFTTDKDGFLTYDIARYDLIFKVKDQFKTDPGKYLQGGEEFVADKNDIEINGIYVDLKKQHMDLAGHDFTKDVFNDDSTPSVGKNRGNAASHYMQSYQPNGSRIYNTYNAYSYSGYTNPPEKTGPKTKLFPHDVRNMIAKVSTEATKGDIYDEHDHRLDISNSKIMPGDRMDVKLVLQNTGDPDSVKEGNTYLQDPAIRYTIPGADGSKLTNMRLMSWQLDTEATVAANVNLSLDESYVYVGTNRMALLSSPDQKQGQFDVVSPGDQDDGVKDIGFMFKGRLGEGEKIVINLIVEFTDELTDEKTGPVYYQNKNISNAGSALMGTMRISGARTHQYQPLALAAGAADLEIDSLSDYWKKVYGSNTTIYNSSVPKDNLKMVGVSSPGLDYKVEDNFNVTKYPLTLLVKSIANHTYHDHTDLAVEVIPDVERTDPNNTSQKKALYGFELAEWPVLTYPEASGWPGYYEDLGNSHPTDTPALYYKVKASDAAWTEVTDLTSTPPQEIYALRWVYKDLPGSLTGQKDELFTLPDVELKGIGHWRNIKKDGDAPDSIYKLESIVGQYYDHAADGTGARDEYPAVPERHNYGEWWIGAKTTIIKHEINRQLPLPELDTQTFTAEPVHTYKYEDPDRMIAYRPGDTFWYKTTVINNKRATGATDHYGTGPLINPVIFDKLPEYISGRGLDQGDGLLYVVYDEEGNPISDERMQQINVVIKKAKTNDPQKDHFGATDIIQSYGSNGRPKIGVTFQNPQEISFDVYEIRFNGLNLEIGERLELWYDATARKENLPMWYTDIGGRRTNAYMPRIGDYYYYYTTSSNGHRTYHYSPRTNYGDDKVESQYMTGDFLLHDVGLSADLNPDAMEKELFKRYTTVMPETTETGSHYTNLRPESVRRVVVNSEDNFKLSGSSIWEYEVEKRVTPYRWLNDKNVMENDGEGKPGVSRNTIWTQSKLHLKKGWLYGASQMVTESGQHISESGGLYNPTSAYSNAVQETDIYTSRLRAVNYGDHMLDGTTFIYVLPRGTEPVFEDDGTISFAGYYGSVKDGPASSDANNGTYEAFAGDEEIVYEILQSPEEKADKGVYPATAKWMEPIAQGGPDDVYKDVPDKQPWILKVTVEAPLGPMWNRTGQTVPGDDLYGTADRSQMFVEFSTRVVKPNADGYWYDELYTTVWDDSGNGMPNSLYMQVRDSNFELYLEDYGYWLASSEPITTPLRELIIRGRFHGVERTSPVEDNTRLGALAEPRTQIDTDFDKVEEQIMYTHTGDALRSRKAMLRVWADVGETTDNSPIGAYTGVRETAEFYRETFEVFDLNIHVHNFQVSSTSAATGGAKGSLFDPVITNILPYGFVPVDTDGKAMALDGSDFNHNVDYQIKMTDVDSEQFKNLWDVKVEYLSDSPTKAGRYQVVWIPKSVEAERVILEYGKTIDIELKVKIENLPQTLANPSGTAEEEDARLFEQWQANRTYVASKSDIAFLGMESGGNITGSATDFNLKLQDRQSTTGFIKANVLGTQALSYEDDTFELEDYVDTKGRPSWLLTKDNLATDFNRNGKINHETEDEDNAKSPVISNTLTIHSRVPRMTTSLSMQTDKNVVLEPNKPISYGNEIWYSINTNNEPSAVSGGSTMDNLMNREQTKGMVKQSWMDYYLWLPGNAGYDGYYEITYQDKANASTVKLNPEELTAAGWEVRIVEDQTAEYAGEPKLLHIRVAPSKDFNPNDLQYRTPKQKGDLINGEGFTLRVRTRALGAHKPLPTSEEWGAYEANIYLKTLQLDGAEDYQPQGIVQYGNEFKEEKDKDINGDGTWSDRYSATKGSFKLRKPSGTIRNDTVKLRSKFGDSGATDYPVYKAIDPVEMIIDDAALLNSTTPYNASVPELIIFSNTLSTKEYAIDKSRNGWKSYITSVSTGIWSMPSGYEISDYVMDVYYTEETGVAFEEFGDRSQWKLLEKDISLTENKTVLIPGDVVAERAIFVIAHKDPALRERVLVPVGTRLDITPDMNEVDRSGSHFEPYPDYVHQRSMLINFAASVDDEQQRFVYNNCSIWARYDKHQYIELDRSFNGGFITPAYPVADIQVRGKYFLRAPGIEPNFGWNTNMVVQLGNSPTLKYQVMYGPVSQAQLDANAPDGKSQKTEDSMVSPQIVVALQDILHVDPLYFKEEKNPAGTPLDDSYTSTQKLDLIDKNREIPKWTYELICDPANIAAEKYSRISNVRAEVAYSEALGRQSIIWSTDGILYPGDYLKFTFIVDISRYDTTTKEQVVGYGYNLNGTMMAYDEENHKAGKERAGRVALFADIRDFNRNGSFVERYITTTVEPTFSFASQYDFPKSKTVRTDLVSEPRTGEPPAAMTEGSIYHFKNTISNTNNPGENDFLNPVLFDILPHVNDTQVSGREEIPGTGTYTAVKRGTRWSGWLIPESVKLYIRPDAEHEPELADSSQYQMWVGPVKYENGQMTPGELNDLPELAIRSQDAFYEELRKSKPEDITAKYAMVPLADVLALKDTNPQLYEQIYKNLYSIFVQMEDPAFKMTGRMDLILEYDMRGPLNLPKFDGDIEDGRGWVPYASWNSYASKTNEMKLGESRFAGVYLNNPEGRAYIGDYVWWDVNYDGVMNEAKLGPDADGNGRDLPQRWLTEYGDVGINGVLVELLTADGYPADKDGNRIRTVIENGTAQYYVLDENGDLKTILGAPVMGSEPVTYTTASDYKGRQGFYILTNLQPGEYRLKYSFPEHYKHFGLTTPATHTGQVAVKGYKAGEVPGNVAGQQFGELPGQTAAAASLTAITDAFAVEAGLDDSDYVDYDLGVALPYRLGGLSWFDSNNDPALNRNGIYEAGEQLLAGTKVTLYEEDGKQALDMLGNPVYAATGAAGEFAFNYILPGRSYYIMAEDNGQIAEIIPTPIRPDDNPLFAKGHNDLYLVLDEGKMAGRTNLFTPSLTGVGTETIDNAIRYVLQDPLGLGYAKPKGGMLLGTIWSDANRDGIWDTEETTLAGTIVNLERYQYLNDKWVKDDTFTPMPVVTDSSGTYLFDDLDRVYKQNGEDVAYAYRTYVKPEHIPAGHAISPFTGDQQQYRRNDMGADGYMPVQHVIFADKITGADMTLTSLIGGVDAGFAPFAPGYISGVAWNDKNQDGVRQDDERLLSQEELVLTISDDGGYKPVKKLNGRYVLPGELDYGNPDAVSVTAVTDDYGAYQFNDLPPGHPLTRQPCLYRVEYTRGEFDNYTGYQWGTDRERDNDFKPEASNSWLGCTQNLMLTKAKPGSLFGYDYMVSMGHDHIDLGLVGAGAIGDYVWLDTNGNGMQDAADETLYGASPGINGVLVELMTSDGFKADVGGRRLVKVGDEYYIADRNGAATTRRAKPVEAVTRTYRGEDGFYLLSGISYNPETNLRLRYTFPDEYAELAGTTNTVYGGTIGVMWVEAGNLYQMGTQNFMVRSLTAVTDEFTLSQNPVVDSETEFDIGVTLPVRVGGIVWIDEDSNTPAYDRNGLYDLGEELVADAMVTLYEKDGTPAKDWFGNPLQSRTNPDGSYLFDTVRPGEYYAEAKLPAQYKNYNPTIKVTEEVFRYDHDNDAQRRKGTSRTGVWELALPVDSGGVVELETGAALRVKAQNGVGFGYATTPKGDIAGHFWIDRNWDGLQDAGEPAAAALEGETVYLKRYRRLSGSQAWEADSDFDTRTTTLDERAEYRFTGLTGFDFTDGEDDDIYVYGYEVWIKNAPSGHGITIRVDNPADRNSDLDREGYLSRMDRLTELAQKDATGRYSLVSVRSENHLDGGFAAYESAVIKGIVWEDENRDGMLEVSERVLPGTRVSLEVYDKDSDSYVPVQNNNGPIVMPGRAGYTGQGWSVEAQADGSYEFAGLPVVSEAKDMAYRYQVVTEKQGEMLWTAVDPAGSLDNKLLEEKDRIQQSASIAVAFSEFDSALTPFPLRESQLGVIVADDHHLGMLTAPTRTISGIVWNDGNKDGWLEDNEGRRGGREVTLYRYHPAADTYEPTADLTGVSMKLTDGNGQYEFKVPIADLNPDSPEYLNPYRYRVVVKKLYTERFSPAEIGEEAELHNKGVKLRKYGYEARIMEDYAVNSVRLVFGEAVTAGDIIDGIATRGYGDRNHIHFGIYDYSGRDPGKPEKPELPEEPKPEVVPIPEVPPNPGSPGVEDGEGLDLNNIDPNGLPAGWMENMDPNGVPRTGDAGPDVRKLLIALAISGSVLFVLIRRRKREHESE